MYHHASCIGYYVLIGISHNNLLPLPAISVNVSINDDTRLPLVRLYLRQASIEYYYGFDSTFL